MLAGDVLKGKTTGDIHGVRQLPADGGKRGAGEWKRALQTPEGARLIRGLAAGPAQSITAVCR